MFLKNFPAPQSRAASSNCSPPRAFCRRFVAARFRSIQHSCPVDAKLGSQLVDGGTCLVRLDQLRACRQASDVVVCEAERV